MRMIRMINGIGTWNIQCEVFSWMNVDLHWSLVRCFSWWIYSKELLRRSDRRKSMQQNWRSRLILRHYLEYIMQWQLNPPKLRKASVSIVVYEYRQRLQVDIHIEHRRHNNVRPRRDKHCHCPKHWWIWEWAVHEWQDLMQLHPMSRQSKQIVQISSARFVFYLQ